MIIGYQVHNKAGFHWNDRPSYEVLPLSVALSDLQESAASDSDERYHLIAINEGDIEEPRFFHVQATLGGIKLDLTPPDVGQRLYDFNVAFAGDIRRVVIPVGIDTGETFNVYHGHSAKSAIAWLGPNDETGIRAQDVQVSILASDVYKRQAETVFDVTTLHGADVVSVSLVELVTLDTTLKDFADDLRIEYVKPYPFATNEPNRVAAYRSTSGEYVPVVLDAKALMAACDKQKIYDAIPFFIGQFSNEWAIVGGDAEYVDFLYPVLLSGKPQDANCVTLDVTLTLSDRYHSWSVAVALNRGDGGEGSVDLWFNDDLTLDHANTVFNDSVTEQLVQQHCMANAEIKHTIRQAKDLIESLPLS